MPPGENGPALRRLSCPFTCGASQPKAEGALKLALLPPPDAREAAPLPFAEAGAGPAQEKTTLRLPPAKPSPGIEAAAADGDGDGDGGRSSAPLLLVATGLREASSAAAAVIFHRGAPGTASRQDTRTQPDRTMRQGSGSGCGSSMHACSGHCGSGGGVGVGATAAGVAGAAGAESASTAAAPAAGLLRAGVAAASTPRASTAAGDCDSRGSGGRRGDSIESKPAAPAAGADAS